MLLAIVPQTVTPILFKAPVDIPMDRMLAVPSQFSHFLSAAQTAKRLASTSDGHAWHLFSPASAPPTHPWDLAHAMVKAAAAAGQDTTYAEPDLMQMMPAASVISLAVNAMALGAPADR